MLFVILSICCSVIILVLLKLAKRYHIDVLQAVTWSYFSVVVVTWLVYKPHITTGVLSSTLSNYNYILLAVLMPVMFMLIKSSIQATGIILTIIATRLSLVVPLIFSFLWFGKVLNHSQLLGIALSLIAIICAIPWKKGRGAKKSTGAWFYLLIIFMGVGLVDVLTDKLILIKNSPDTTSLFITFVMAFIVSMLFVAIQIARKKTRFSVPHVLIGCVLGFANFGRVFFYLKGMKALDTQPSGFFLAINIGIITLGTLVALLIFNEKLSIINKIAIFFTLVAVLVLSNKFINAV
ncbi:MAG: EamA/RhaT family transporter [Mucilaginibacter sp.]